MSKSYLFSLLLIPLLCTCGRAEKDETAETVEEIQTAIKDKRAEVRELTKDIDSLETKLFALKPELAPKGTLVAFEAVATQSFEDYANVQATVVASESAVASPQIPGRILRMNFEEGDAIRKGQLVAVLDVEDITTQRAELETAAELAKTVYERQKKLWDQNIGSEIQYLQAKNNYERTQKQLAQIDVQANKRNVYAPISGTVDRVFQRQGETAGPGAPILSILNTNDLEVVADAPEDLLTRVKVGQKVRVRVPTAGTVFEAPITRIGKTVDPANRTFEIETSIPRNVRRQLKANLLAEVEVLDFAAEDVIVVSQDQIQQEIDGRRYVFVVSEEDGETVARKRYIKTGGSYDNRAVVEEGLAVGDRIITAGGRGLTDGQKISLG